MIAQGGRPRNSQTEKFQCQRRTYAELVRLANR